MSREQSGEPIWGPEIPVNGKRPEWLADSDKLEFYDFAQARWNGVPGIDAAFMDQSDWWRFASVIRLPADHPYYQQADVDTVTIKRMTKDEAKAKWVYPGCASANTFVIALEAMGLIKPDPTPLDRFMAVHPTADRATAEKALEWGREE